MIIKNAIESLLNELPMVTVIIPNYNHERYLPQRIESVLKQTYQDFELLLLDDCSPDNSREILATYAARDNRIKLIFNEKNSGSTFKQWNKGINLANGKYIWLAESDDYADERLLETLVEQLEADENIGVAYCDSWSVDEHSRVIGDWVDFYSELDNKLWTSDFVLEGSQLLNKFMSYRNIIPNASAVVIRKIIIMQAGLADESFRVNGDWVFWAKILAISKIAFSAKKLNFFRQHTNNVRSATIMDGTALIEKVRLLHIIKKIAALDYFFYNKMLDSIVGLWVAGIIEYNIPLARHRYLYYNLKQLDTSFHQRFWSNFNDKILSNNLSGLKFLVKKYVINRIVKRH
ncbi:glycosyltransferase family 2 protein [Hymenobacter nivis]|uniref:Glycosyltransferase family 2 protein n=1 Tax=Hymenobacter nivis TaxID=1850093 RepID=A0A502HCL1_9BACT|nr:glycosyltransferase family 2 protein [Hymenobacter nivis]TPG72261.1 glycosyltransferase family 2 protein [Hymenobacter nivis]